jgi:uncharacterized repeat protein (TIGR01451 family)
MWHTTIARNSGGDGSGVHLRSYDPTTISLTNTILTSHTVGITAGTNSLVTLNGVLWFDNGTNTGGDGAITVTHAYTGDPAFIALQPGHYHLSPASAALDRGVETGVGEDIDGEPRPFGSHPDLGADEGRPALRLIKSALPEQVRAGEPLTYTLRLTNTGFTTLTAAITDILPGQVTPAEARTWRVTLPAPNGIWSQQVVVTVAEGYAGPLTNVLHVSSREGASGVYTHSLTAAYVYYLPLIFKE